MVAHFLEPDAAERIFADALRIMRVNERIHGHAAAVELCDAPVIIIRAKEEDSAGAVLRKEQHFVASGRGAGDAGFQILFHRDSPFHQTFLVSDRLLIYKQR